jgi:hypothetical protein
MKKLDLNSIVEREYTPPKTETKTEFKEEYPLIPNMIPPIIFYPTGAIAASWLIGYYEGRTLLPKTSFENSIALPVSIAILGAGILHGVYVSYKYFKNNSNKED